MKITFKDGVPDFLNLEDELRTYVLLESNGKFYNRVTGNELSVQAFNMKYQKFMNKKSFRPSDFVFSELDCQTVVDKMYYPLEKPSSVFAYRGQSYVNSVRVGTIPMATENSQIDKNAKILCSEHICKVFKPEDARVLIQWLAHNVQFPGKKILWTPILVGIPGDGKTTIGNMLAAAMGESHVNVVGPEALDSAFNSYATGSCVVILEEVRIIGKSRFDVISKLKPLIANERAIDVVMKGKDGMSVPNCTNYMALTNHEDALILDEDDRRWAVLKTKFSSRSEVLETLKSEYWDCLHDAYKNNPLSVRDWLLQVDLSSFDRTKPPESTIAKQNMVEASLPKASEDILDLIGTEEGIGEHIIATSMLREKMRLAGFRYPSGHALKFAMKQIGFVPSNAVVFWMGKNTRYYYNQESFPDGCDPSQAREALDETKTYNELDDTKSNVTPIWKREEF